MERKLKALIVSNFLELLLKSTFGVKEANTFNLLCKHINRHSLLHYFYKAIHLFQSYFSPMTQSITTLEDCEEKQRAAEERRKKLEAERKERAEQAEKHAKEVRANRWRTL